MATWVIGDVQGCYEPLRRLVDATGIDLGPDGDDRLWLTGDLVNRGPESAEVLRWVKGLGDRAVTVLGNHDLHLIGMALGVRQPGRGDTAQSVLDEPDGEALIQWLRWRPLVHADDARKTLLVHAGLLPQWTWRAAVQLGRELEPLLRGPMAVELLRPQSSPDWSPGLGGFDRWRSAVAALTRLRACDAAGRQARRYKGTLDGVPEGYTAWFDAPDRRWTDRRVVFGHWAALGVLVRDDVVGCDSGCVWGNALTAFCLDDGRLVSVSAAPA